MEIKIGEKIETKLKNIWEAEKKNKKKKNDRSSHIEIK